jgi:hypothetical protein
MFDLYLLDCHSVIVFEDLVIEDQLKLVVVDEDIHLIVIVLTKNKTR